MNKSIYVYELKDEKGWEKGVLVFRIIYFNIEIKVV